MPCAQFATVVAPVKTTASQPATTVAASPLGLGSDDGSIPAADSLRFSGNKVLPKATEDCRHHFTNTSLAKKALA